ncbi:hypothetical protein P4U65_35220 [Bacillus pacificus]|nr:hypothetical protein [Bacillus thuringiensis]MED1305627.1 hypothetical protein [Bacillus pacificus]
MEDGRIGFIAEFSFTQQVWLYAKCRKYVDEENPKEDEAELEITGEYDGNDLF